MLQRVKTVAAYILIAGQTKYYFLFKQTIVIFSYAKNYGQENIYNFMLKCFVNQKVCHLSVYSPKSLTITDSPEMAINLHLEPELAPCSGAYGYFITLLPSWLIWIRQGER